MLRIGATPVTEAERIALDEDDLFAVVTRRVVEESEVLRKGELIAMKIEHRYSPALHKSDDAYLTDINGLYLIAQDLYPGIKEGFPRKADAKNGVFTETHVRALFERVNGFWEALASSVREVALVAKGRGKPGEYRQKDKNNVLFRPIGQRALAGAVQVLASRGMPLDRAVKRLTRGRLDLSSGEWHFILWDPIERHMLTRNRALAETHLLVRAGAKPRSRSRENRYEDLLKHRSEHPRPRRRK